MHKGDALPRPARESLAAAHDDWLRLRAPTLAPATQRSCEAVWDAHVRGRFDHHALNELVAEPQLFEELTADMRERGVGPASQRRVLAVISAVLTAQVDWKKIAVNPALRIRKPRATVERYPGPVPPVVVERIRVRIMRRPTLDPSGVRAMAEAALVSVVSYAGLRPAEALALTWDDVGYRSLSVDKALRDGVPGPTKTGVARTVPVSFLVNLEVQALRASAGLERIVNPIVFPSADGGYWSDSEFRNWRARVWKPVLRDLAASDAALATLAGARPYDCRGSFVSLHLRSGASPLEVAKWAGHSPAVMFRHYANVIEELRGEPVISVEEQIARARDAVEQKEAAELDRLVADLYEHPNVGVASKVGAAS